MLRFYILRHGRIITFASETALPRSTVNCRDYIICGLFKVAARVRTVTECGVALTPHEKALRITASRRANNAVLQTVVTHCLSVVR